MLTWREALGAGVCGFVGAALWHVCGWLSAR